MTGVVTLVMLVAITALATLTAEAHSARSRIRFVQRALTVEAGVTMALATGSMDERGVSAAARQQDGIILDGRPYVVQAGGPVQVALQDQAGLINVASIDQETFERLLETIGTKAEVKAGAWDRYLDYTDTDDDVRLRGAERRNYGADPPPNAPLRTPAQFLQVLGMREGVDPVAWRFVRNHLATDRTSASFNVNTATAPTLEIRFGLTPAQAERVIRERQTAPIRTVSEFAAMARARIIISDEEQYTFPSGRIVFELRDGLSPWIWRGRLTLTPMHSERPFWVDQSHFLEAPKRAIPDTSGAEPLPLVPVG